MYLNNCYGYNIHGDSIINSDFRRTDDFRTVQRCPITSNRTLSLWQVFTCVNPFCIFVFSEAILSSVKWWAFCGHPHNRSSSTKVPDHVKNILTVVEDRTRLAMLLFIQSKNGLFMKSPNLIGSHFVVYEISQYDWFNFCCLWNLLIWLVHILLFMKSPNVIGSNFVVYEIS